MQKNKGYSSKTVKAYLKQVNENFKHSSKKLNLNLIATPLGEMLSLSDQCFLYLLEFADKKNLVEEIKETARRQSAFVVLGDTSINQRVRKQLREYFSGERKSFSLPLCKSGTPFQKSVWAVLQKIPAGETLSYQEVAARLGNAKLVRAVGSANRSNKLALVIPCHRVIRANGELGGYAGGVERKLKLLQLERGGK
ncbi:methylated-DNA-protein-cysteine methyltransferase [Liquorilactobacillus sucicola DSM 21376 = JCM 15457]|uniref:Methylated-DNA--protein-cysteine methyltransferase n=1 Tax=Liquorilactobacillus sucicola DSM 21376 = JCM 15457 TaxID=1423806 RepID=A0A023CYQ7_9LACO|nr:methylated-DNA--[protein]-cysteine S-methyltransferase [Liquorilactobacillus sucicola]KRN06769.1 methylated-DNA--protein-cysteine methyltransferase [Liquorilactobacillus sucicola DSM 21376 = JCM 15457]GAJ27043.1 methylated-DNA-protein-cysteine methyltransferase [Liquorilactobacillus sucicola DSM 21376 = JCM 15457]